jgi:S1-C subfamily serine protease
LFEISEKIKKVNKEMQTHQATIDDLNRYTVAIQQTKEDGGIGRILGTGVIITYDGLILTCYHVIGNIMTKTLDYKTIDIYFPSNPNAKGRADVLEKYSDSSVDIAFLQLQGKLPEQVAVANLSKTIDPAHTFRSFGFRKEKTFYGLYADGIIQGKVQKKFKTDDNNISLQEVIQLKSDGIDHGMSGSAVLDTQINRVIGIVSEYLATSSNIDKNLALAIPIESILNVYPAIKERNPRLRIIDVLRRVGQEGIKILWVDDKWDKDNKGEIKRIADELMGIGKISIKEESGTTGAADELDNRKYDLVISDMERNRKDSGLNLLYELLDRKKTKKAEYPPVIIFHEKHAKKYLKKANELGAAEVVSKSDSEKLMNTIAYILDHYK